jgi:DNA-binding transcriptional ArsR family regulator
MCYFRVLQEPPIVPDEKRVSRTRSTAGRTLSELDPAVFKALADPVRLEVVARLACAARPLTVTEVGDCCGVHISGVSRHLSQLRRAGLVLAEKDGREMQYRLNAENLTRLLRGLADAIDASPCCSPSPPAGESRVTGKRTPKRRERRR